MLTSLKFVQGSISKKDFIPELSHFVIENGHIRGYNGIIALGSPIPFNVDCKPRAELLVKAISNCKDSVTQLSMTASGRLAIKSGKFKSFIECTEGEVPHVIPEGNIIPIDGSKMIEAFKKLQSFVGTDASRPWCEGILLKDKSAFATNNVILIEYWLGVSIPFPICIPKVAIKELLRIGEVPTCIKIKDNSISFIFEGNRWLRSQLLETNWPTIETILNQPSLQLPLSVDLFEGIDLIKPFCDKLNRAFILNNVLSTHYEPNEGASFQLEGLGKYVDSCYNIDMLSLLKNTVKTIDWTTYPKPCLFTGDNIRGCIIGLKL